MAVVFISSTFRDLSSERQVISDALRQSDAAPWGMEFFVSEPSRPLDVCLREIGQADAVILVLGFRAGSLVPRSSTATYTQAEFEEALGSGKPIFVFEKRRGGLWRNDETSNDLSQALNDFKSKVHQADVFVHDCFENDDQLKAAVSMAFAKWHQLGMPGARKIFASFDEHFAPYRSSASVARLFDHNLTLQGRVGEIEALNSWVANERPIGGVLVGRGGVGKTKLLHDWTSDLTDRTVVYLREHGVWHRDSGKELPVGRLLIVVDDAHRSQHLENLTSFVRELSVSRPVKLLLGTRPSGTRSVRAALCRQFDSSQITIFPELNSLEIKDVRALAAEVLV